MPAEPHAAEVLDEWPPAEPTARVTLPDGDLPDALPVVTPPGWTLCFTCTYVVRADRACPVCSGWSR